MSYFIRGKQGIKRILGIFLVITMFLWIPSPFLGSGVNALDTIFSGAASIQLGVQKDDAITEDNAINFKVMNDEGVEEEVETLGKVYKINLVKDKHYDFTMIPEQDQESYYKTILFLFDSEGKYIEENEGDYYHYNDETDEPVDGNQIYFDSPKTGTYYVVAASHPGKISEGLFSLKVNAVSDTSVSDISISGHVKSADGKPVNDAEVYLQYYNPESEDGDEDLPDESCSTTDTNGNFVLSRIPGLEQGSYRLEVRHSLYKTAYSSVFEITSSTENFSINDITLEKGNTVSGTLKDSYNRPVSNARVYIDWSDGDEEYGYKSSYSDENGQFVIGGLSAGELELICSSYHNDYTDSYKEFTLNFGQNENKDLGIIQVDSGVKISGMITDQDTGKPIGGATVEVYASLGDEDGGFDKTTYSEANGTYSMGGLPNRFVDVYARCEGYLTYEGEHDATVDNPNLNISLKKKTDLIAPKVVTTTPSHGMTGVDVNTRSFSVEFSEKMDTEWGTVELSEDQYGEIALGDGEWSSDGKTVTYALDSNESFKSGKSYTIRVYEFGDLSGNSLRYGEEVTFVVGTSSDKVVPKISGTKPMDGAKDVDVNTKSVSVTFDEAMNKNTGTVLLKDNTNQAVALKKASWNATGKTVSYMLDDNAKFEYGKTYTLSVNNDFADLAGNKLSAQKTATFTIKSAPATDPDPEPTVTAVTMSAPPKHIQVGNSHKFTASVLPAGINKKVIWSVSNANATVDQTGKVTAKKEGSVIVKASVDGKSASRTVKIVSKVTNIQTPMTSVNLSYKKSYTPRISCNSGTATVKTAMVWTSSNTKVAKVSKTTGKITALKKAGSATITGTAANGKTVKIKVKVVKKATKVKKVKASGLKSSYKEGAVAYIKVKATPAKATNFAPTFKSSKSSIASVDKSGKVTFKKKGKVKITIKAGGKKVVKTIIVEERRKAVIFKDFR